MSHKNKSKLNFEDLVGKTETNFEVSGENIASEEVNNNEENILFNSNLDDNGGSLKKTKKNKEYQYKKIFDNSLQEHKNLKKTAHIYDHNMTKINILSSLNKNVNLTEIINYILNDFFIKNSDEIREEYKIISSDLNKNL